MGSGAAQQPVTTVDQLGGLWCYPTLQSDKGVEKKNFRKAQSKPKSLTRGENNEPINPSFNPFCRHHILLHVLHYLQSLSSVSNSLYSSVARKTCH